MEEIKRETSSNIDDLPLLPYVSSVRLLLPPSQQTAAELVWGDKSSHRNSMGEKCHRPWSPIICLAQILAKLQILWHANNDTKPEELSAHCLGHFKSYLKKMQLDLNPACSRASQNFIYTLLLICSLCTLIWAGFNSSFYSLHYPWGRIVCSCVIITLTFQTLYGRISVWLTACVFPIAYIRIWNIGKSLASPKCSGKSYSSSTQKEWWLSIVTYIKVELNLAWKNPKPSCSFSS